VYVSSSSLVGDTGRIFTNVVWLSRLNLIFTSSVLVEYHFDLYYKYKHIMMVVWFKCCMDIGDNKMKWPVFVPLYISNFVVIMIWIYLDVMLSCNYGILEYIMILLVTPWNRKHYGLGFKSTFAWHNTVLFIAIKLYLAVCFNYT